MATEKLYKIIFNQGNKVYEVYAKNVFSADLYGFIQVENFVFGETSEILIDPAEEKLAAEFANVKSSFIPMYNVVRIDEVSHKGKTKISDLKVAPPQVISLNKP